MKARIVASVVLAAGVMLGTSGCNLLAPQATTKQYDPSDGVGANVGDLSIRNAFLVTEDGETANFVFTVVSTSTEDQQLAMQYTGAEGSTTVNLSVAAGTTTVVGTEDGAQVILDDLDVVIGSLLPVYFQYGSEEGESALVPVLNAELPEYQDLLPPSVTPTAIPTLEPTAVPTEGASEGATDGDTATPTPEPAEG